jgi:hypothetical protein
MAYEFFYWPEIQGRGEFVCLALEDAGAAYIDVARGLESEGRGVPAMLALLRGRGTSHIPFAPRHRAIRRAAQPRREDVERLTHPARPVRCRRSARPARRGAPPRSRGNSS